MADKLGVIGTPGAASVGEHEDAFDVVHERLGFAKIGGAGAVLDGQAIDSVRPVLRMILRERPVTSATMSVPKRCTIWSSAP